MSDKQTPTGTTRLSDREHWAEMLHQLAMLGAETKGIKVKRKVKVENE